MMKNIARITVQMSETLPSMAINIEEMLQNIKIPAFWKKEKKQISWL